MKKYDIRCKQGATEVVNRIRRINTGGIPFKAASTGTAVVTDCLFEEGKGYDDVIHFVKMYFPTVQDVTHYDLSLFD